MSTMTKRIDGILDENEDAQRSATVAAEQRYLEILRRSALDESNEAEAQEVLHLAKLLNKSIADVKVDAKAFAEAAQCERFIADRRAVNDDDLLRKLKSSQLIRDKLRKELEAVEDEVNHSMWELRKRSNELSDAQQRLLQLRRQNFRLFGLRSPDDADMRVSLANPVTPDEATGIAAGWGRVNRVAGTAK